MSDVVLPLVFCFVLFCGSGLQFVPPDYLGCVLSEWPSLESSFFSTSERGEMKPL